jgi:signal transduction histidine kinase/CheY-like chemotaxis protein
LPQDHLLAAEQHDNEHVRNLELLSKTAMEFVELPPDGDLYSLIAERLKQIVGDRVVLSVSNFEEEKGTFRPRAVLGIGWAQKFLDNLLGRSPLDLSGDFGPEAKEALATGRLAPILGGIHGLASPVLSKTVSRAVEKFFSIESIHVIGFSRSGKIFGGVCLIRRRGAAPLNQPLIEAFVGQAAVALESRRSLERLRATELQLQQSQKLEAVGRLAGGIAHDFNNMLSGILGFGGMIRDSLQKNDPLQEDLEEILVAAKRAATLTGQLLAFSRKQVLAPMELDLNLVVEDLERMLHRLIGEDIELCPLLRPGLGRVWADPGQIEQVLANLVVNARDAMPGGGQLTIETGNADLSEVETRRIGLNRSGAHVMLLVRDNGCGMDQDTLGRVFEPFFTTKAAGKGTGLGLSTAYGIIKQSGGGIDVQSERGVGTTFKVFLPRIQATGEVTTTRAKEVAPSLAGSDTVLVVEDERVVRHLVVRVLERAGYKVLSAGHPGEALLTCEAHEEPIHLLVTDVVMPQMSGPEIAARLLKLQPEMKVLFTSGHTDDVVLRSGVARDEAAFLKKPFTVSELLSRVREVLAS